MRSTLLLTCALAMPATTFAAVVELDGDALVNVAVQGISIGQIVTDKQFARDDLDQRDAEMDRQAVIAGNQAPEITVSNAEALTAPPQLDALIPATLAAIGNKEVRDLTEDALVNTAVVRQNVLGVQLNVNYEAARAAGLNLADSSALDPGALRNSLMELMPSSTGYQFELMK
jgi:hypothetical protein